MQALAQTLWSFKYQFLFCLGFLIAWSAVVIYYSLGIYAAWGGMWYCILHLVAPIALNPAIVSNRL
jgi:hypothetical protein